MTTLSSFPSTGRFAIITLAIAVFTFSCAAKPEQRVRLRQVEQQVPTVQKQPAAKVALAPTQKPKKNPHLTPLSKPDEVSHECKSLVEDKEFSKSEIFSLIEYINQKFKYYSPYIKPYWPYIFAFVCFFCIKYIKKATLLIRCTLYLLIRWIQKFLVNLQQQMDEVQAR
ncbi:MAG: hypothetical protein LBU89_04275 [Fibromonadaceae bacterium]|nr:hypothetical protein [Fibromonadaceae bacterium]